MCIAALYLDKFGCVCLLGLEISEERQLLQSSRCQSTLRLWWMSHAPQCSWCCCGSAFALMRSLRFCSKDKVVEVVSKDRMEVGMVYLPFDLRVMSALPQNHGLALLTGGSSQNNGSVYVYVDMHV